MSADKVLMDREEISYAVARERVLAAVRNVRSETVPLSKARGRALGRAVIATHSLPPFSNSAMDGFAVRSRDLVTASGMSPVELVVVETIAAGRVATTALGEGEAMRIMTGAQIPEGADAVVPLEKAETLSSGAQVKVWFTEPTEPHANVRHAGTDLEIGAEALPVGREISAHDVALLASLGCARVEVGSRPRVTLVSTGDELLSVEQPLRPGAIRDSNLPLLRELIEEAGCELVEAVHVSDDPVEVTRCLTLALSLSDVVISVGGVSAGDFDPVKESLSSLEGAQLWRVALRPGQPQAFAASEGKLFFGLPGNPASVACVFEALVRPALRKMQGFSRIERPRLLARAADTIASRAGRTDFVRVTLEWRNDEWWARPAGAQVSGFVSTQSRAHGLLIVPDNQEMLSEGDPAETILLRWPSTAALDIESVGRGTSKGGPQWKALNDRPRHAGSQIVPNSIPSTPGVYAWFRNGEPIFVGGASNLRMRIWRDHLSEELSLARSELRRRAAEHLGFATSQEIHLGLYTPTEGDVDSVRRWLRSCEIAWIEMKSDEDASNLEKALIGEWTPPFNKR